MKFSTILFQVCFVFLSCKDPPKPEPNPEKQVPRIVSVSPNTTETIYTLEAGFFLVGRSRYCDFPEEAKSKPIVGGFSDPNLEKILALSPTLVIGAHGPAGAAFEKNLNDQKIATFFPETESITQIEAMIRGLGKMLHLEMNAERTVAQIEADKSSVVKAVQSLPKVKTLLLFDTSPIIVAGPGSFGDELIALAGGINLATSGGFYPQLGIEHVIALDPDVLLDGVSEESESSLLNKLSKLPGWKEMRAVKQKRVVSIGGSISLRPGPRIGRGLMAIAYAIHNNQVKFDNP